MARPAGSDTTQPRSTPPRTVLVIESAGFPLHERHRALGGGGFRVQIANSGHVAASAVKNACPDVVLLCSNVGPPGASEIARRIKKDPATRAIPIVLLDSEEHPPPFAYPTEARLAHDVGEDELLGTLRMLTSRAPKLRYSGRRDTASLEGRLDVDDFPEVLQFLFATKKVGRIVVVDGARRRGLIAIDDGDVVDAVLDDHRGVPAFVEMCFLPTGTFRFEPQAPARRTMQVSGLELLLESARRKDVSALTPPPSPTPFRLSAPQGRAQPERRPMPRRRLVSVQRGRHYGLAALLVGLVGAGTLFARVAFDRSPSAVAVTIVSEPAGARVFVDEREVGTTPVASLDVEPGKRLFRLVREGSQATVELVEVDPNDDGRALRFSMAEAPPEPAVLRLRSLPARAKIYVDGVRQAGARTELAPGSYRVDVEVAGFAPWTEQIQLEPAMQKILDVELRRRE